MLSALFTSKKKQVESHNVTPCLQLLNCEDGVDKKTLSLTCDRASSIRRIEDQLNGYFRIISEKIISDRTINICERISLKTQFPQYFYSIDIVKTESHIQVNITGSDLALQSAIESLIYGKLCESSDFRALPPKYREYAKAVEDSKITTPKMF